MNRLPNQYMDGVVLDHHTLPVFDADGLWFYRCVVFDDCMYGRTVSELHAGNLRVPGLLANRHSRLFPGHKVSYWADTKVGAIGEVRKWNGNAVRNRWPARGRPRDTTSLNLHLAFGIVSMVVRKLILPEVPGMGLRDVPADRFGGPSPREQPGILQGHLEDSMYGFVGFGGDVPGRLHILAAQVQEMVAVIDDGHGPGVTVAGLQLGQALEDDTDGDFPGADDGRNPVEVRDAAVRCGGEVVQDETYRHFQAAIRFSVGKAA